MNSNVSLSASRVSKPDLDWSQVHETVLMLNLAVAQIEGALKSGDDSVNSLADSFTSMVEHVETIATANQQVPDSEEKSTIGHHCQSVSTQMRATIVAFQFYDKLTQRLTHLSGSLESLAALVSQPENLYNPYSWRGLQEKIKSSYTLEADKAMFNAILAGKTVQEALKLLHHCETDNAKDDDVELF